MNHFVLSLLFLFIFNLGLTLGCIPRSETSRSDLGMCGFFMTLACLAALVALFINQFLS